MWPGENRVRNEKTRRRMDVRKVTITVIEEKRLIWYGHVRRADKSR